MKALVKYSRGHGNMELREVASPLPAHGEVIVRVSRAGLCGSDLHIFEDRIAIPIRVPVVVGHEFCGRVIGVGGGVDPAWVGRRVTAMPSVRVCGRCRFCREGALNLCASRESMGYWHDGAFAPECVVPVRCLRCVPDDIEDGAAALVEPLACAVHAVEEVTVIPAGATVAIVGPGTIGLLCLQVALAAGARVAVYGTARDTHRLRLAEQLGAHATGVGMTADEVDNPTGDGVDFVFECSGNADGAALGLRLTRRMGHYTQVGLFGEPPRLDFDTTVVARELTIRGSFGQRPSSWDRALELMAAGSVNPAALITHVLPLQDWESGFEVCRSGRAGKVLFDLSGIDAARPRPASGGAGPKTVPDRS